MSIKGKRILVTGGAGYIGSHTVVQLIEAGAHVVILDNLCNSKRDVIGHIEQITGQCPEFIEGDIRDRGKLRMVFANEKFDAVIHFAGLKAVGESVAEPLKYYENNVSGSLVLFEEMARAGVRSVVFSSSATVYGNPASVPISEDFPLKPINPYGRSKLMVEDILRDLHEADPSWRVAVLRYFNPAGAHKSGLIGEDTCVAPNNLMPLIAKVASGRQSKVAIFGNDYPTPDGTGIRDYIHVDDLASGHLAALNVLQQHAFLTVNLGTGRGYSVLEMIRAFERASGETVPYDVLSRRPGDVAECRADPEFAKTMLDWNAKNGIDRICTDAWRWESRNNLDS